jgi:hypothetical protein
MWWHGDLNANTERFLADEQLYFSGSYEQFADDEALIPNTTLEAKRHQQRIQFGLGRPEIELLLLEQIGPEGAHQFQLK